MLQVFMVLIFLRYIVKMFSMIVKRYRGTSLTFTWLSMVYDVGFMSLMVISFALYLTAMGTYGTMNVCLDDNQAFANETVHQLCSKSFVRMIDEEGEMHTGRLFSFRPLATWCSYQLILFIAIFFYERILNMGEFEPLLLKLREAEKAGASIEHTRENLHKLAKVVHDMARKGRWDMTAIKVVSVVACYFSASSLNSIADHFGEQRWAFILDITGHMTTDYLVEGVCVLPGAIGSEVYTCEVSNAQLWYSLSQMIWFVCHFWGTTTFILLVNLIFSSGRSMSTHLMLINWPGVLHTYQRFARTSDECQLYAYILPRIRPGGGYAISKVRRNLGDVTFNRFIVHLYIQIRHDEGSANHPEVSTPFVVPS